MKYYQMMKREGLTTKDHKSIHTDEDTDIHITFLMMIVTTNSTIYSVFHILCSGKRE